MNIIDTSEVVLLDEPFFMNNIKEKTVYTVSSSKSCEDLNYNLGEYKSFVERYAVEKNFNLDFDYTTTPCEEIPVTVDLTIKLTSSKSNMTSNFVLQWSGE